MQGYLTCCAKIPAQTGMIDQLHFNFSTLCIFTSILQATLVLFQY